MLATRICGQEVDNGSLWRGISGGDALLGGAGALSLEVEIDT